MIFKNEHLTRQMDLIPMEVLGEKITIIGAGAIGSWTALALVKMGFTQIEVWDDDTVSVENLSCQFFRQSDIGHKKTLALQTMVAAFAGSLAPMIQIKTCRYERGTFSGIVVSAVDSMEVRRTIWENHKEKAFGCRAIIDPRMGAENALLYVMNPMDGKDAESYEKTLYSDSQAVQERCTAKATIYTANLLSGLVCKAVKDLLTRPDYLRSAQWSIAENQFLGFQKKVS